MATVPQTTQAPLWFTFTAEQREQLVRDDIQAGKTVSMVLVTVITLGMLFGLATVLLIGV
jgi:hypothetical protein